MAHQVGDFVEIVPRGYYATIIAPGNEPGLWWLHRRLSFWSTHMFQAHERDFGQYTVRSERREGVTDEEIGQAMHRVYNVLLDAKRKTDRG